MRASELRALAAKMWLEDAAPDSVSACLRRTEARCRLAEAITPAVLDALEAIELLNAAQEAAEVTQSAVNAASARHYASLADDDAYQAWVQAGNTNLWAQETYTRASTYVRICARRLSAEGAKGDADASK